MNFDLHRGLHDLSGEPVVPTEVVPVLRVLSRVRRVRALRTAAASTVSTAAVVGFAVVVQAVGHDGDSPAPAGTTSAPAPAATPSPTPKASRTPAPTSVPVEPPQALAVSPIVAVTSAGEVVLLDPGTGTTLRVVRAGIATTDDPTKVSISVNADSTVAYVSHSPASGIELLRISLADGATSVVAVGLEPALSPDGRTLAYAGPDQARAMEGDSWGLNLLDLASGATRHLSAGPYDPERLVGQPTWSTDGAQLFAPFGWAGGEAVVVIDPRTATTLQNATTVGPRTDAGTHGESWDEPDLLVDGRLALFSSDVGYEATAESGRVGIADPQSGQVTRWVEGLAGRWVMDIEAQRDGARVAVLAGAASFAAGDPVGWALFIWDGGDAVTEIAHDLVAVAW